MTYKFPLILFAISLIATTGQATFAGPNDDHVVFRAKNGAVIDWHRSTGILHTPQSRNIKLSDCSDEFQTCFTDYKGFSFAYPRSCIDIDDKRLRFQPRIVAALHDHVWMIYEEAPDYMFHYLVPKGIVGIYVRTTHSSEFRRYLRDRSGRLSQLDAKEFRVMNSRTVAACKTEEN